jgi:hypothetical protein
MANHPNRASIRQDGADVVLRCTDPYTGERQERRFWCPQGGGYVREVTDIRPGTLGQQVCDGLAYRGSALAVRSRDDLLPLIRRQWHAAKQAAARDMARW